MTDGIPYRVALHVEGEVLGAVAADRHAATASGNRRVVIRERVVVEDQIVSTAASGVINEVEEVAARRGERRILNRRQDSARILRLQQNPIFAVVGAVRSDGVVREGHAVSGGAGVVNANVARDATADEGVGDGGRARQVIDLDRALVKG